MRKADVMAALRRHEPELRRLGVVRLALFGSMRRDEAGPDSDIDLVAFYAPGRLDFRSFFGAKHLIEDTLGRRVDFTTPDALHAMIRDRVLASAEPVFS